VNLNGNQLHVVPGTTDQSAATLHYRLGVITWRTGGLDRLISVQPNEIAVAAGVMNTCKAVQNISTGHRVE
jgi:hypothetical protein